MAVTCTSIAYTGLAGWNVRQDQKLSAFSLGVL